MNCFLVSWSFASLLHLHFHCLPLLMQHFFHNPCPSSVFYKNCNHSSLSTFLFYIDSGQCPYDGPFLGHCLVCIFGAMATSWGLGSSGTFEAPMCLFNERPKLSASQRSLCVWMGALSSSLDSMFVDSRREGFVRACHYKRQFAPVPALLSLTVSQCGYLKWWAVTIVMFLSMLGAWLHG